MEEKGGSVIFTASVAAKQVGVPCHSFVEAFRLFFNELRRAIGASEMNMTTLTENCWIECHGQLGGELLRFPVMAFPAFMVALNLGILRELENDVVLVEPAPVIDERVLAEKLREIFSENLTGVPR